MTRTRRFAAATVVAAALAAAMSSAGAHLMAGHGTCICVHPRVVHQYNRPGSSCGVCNCPRYRSALLRLRLRTWLA